jgi:hypothetical protein
LDGPEKGLLRLIQLAVASDVRSIEVCQGRDAVRLSFLGGQRFSLDPSGAPESVRVALLSLLHHGFAQADLCPAGKRYKLSLSGAEVVDQTSLAQVTSVMLHRRLSGSFWDRWRQSLRARLLDSAVLLDGLRHCPILVKVDVRAKTERAGPAPDSSSPPT